MKLSRREFSKVLVASAAALGLDGKVGGRPRPVDAAAGIGRPVEGGNREELLSLIYRYSYTYDAKDLDGFIALFTEDAVWEVYSVGSSVPLLSLGSRDALRSFVDQRMAQLRTQGVQSRHYQTNTILTTSAPRSAQGVTMLLLTWQFSSETAARIMNTGYYRDHFVDTIDGWRFARREAYTDQH